MRKPFEPASRQGLMWLGLVTAMACGCSGQAVVDSSHGDAGAPPDGGSSDVDGGLPPDPGSVDCNGTPCETPRELCCIEDPGAQQIWQCMEESDDVHCGALQRQCDEAADCPANHKCCVPMTARPYPAYSTHCAPECDSFYWFQVCKTSAECSGDTSCVLQLCQGQPLQTCGALDDPHGFCG